MTPTPPAQHTGRYGTAEVIPWDMTRPDAAETVVGWLLTAPGFHPHWSQYLLIVVRLRDDVPGFRPPYRRFPDATHELLVLAVDPTHGRYTPESFAATTDRGLPVLTPVNVAEQVNATDEEMLQIASLAAAAVTHAQLWPETGDAPEYIRATWRTAITATLNHIRAGVHP